MADKLSTSPGTNDSVLGSKYSTGAFSERNIASNPKDSSYFERSDSENDSNDSSDSDGHIPKSLREAPSASDQKTTGPNKNKKTKKGKKNDKSSNKQEDKDDKISREILTKTEKYRRGMKAKTKGGEKDTVRSKKAQVKIEHEQRRRATAIRDAARAEVLLTEEAGFIEAEGIERTYAISQKELADNLDINSTQKIFNLDLPDYGPYKADYTRNGRNLLIGGKKGHVATMDWRNGKLIAELHLRETVRDVSWLHNESLFAVAQKQYTYIYDHTGAEVHCLKKHAEATSLGFLPHHFLLASTGLTGKLVYQDVTEGLVVAEHKPGYGQCHVLRVNPYNAVVHLGHGNGTVTLWSPKAPRPLAQILCHRGPVQAMAIDRAGKYMATSGMDGQLKIWDIRNFKELHSYYTTKPASSLDISQRGLLAAGWGSTVRIWKDALTHEVEEPYMRHRLEQTSSSISDINFVPYDDVLGCAHTSGLSSIVVPGSGEPNFDAFVANPFQTTKQRQETEVKSLLDKLPPDTIALDPNFIGRLDPRSRALREKEQFEQKADEYKDNKKQGMYLDNTVRNRTRGRNSTAKRYRRKREGNIMDLKKLQELDRLEKIKRDQEAKRRKIPEEEKGALGKFYEDKWKRG